MLDVCDATVVANDTAGGLLLLALDSSHPALSRIGRLVLTNCDSYDQFPPDSLKKAAALNRAFPRLGRMLMRMNVRSPSMLRRTMATVTAHDLEPELHDSFAGPIRRDPKVAGDLVAAMAGCRPELLVTAARAIPRFDRPVLLVWGDACQFFPMALAERLAADFPHATLVPVPGAKTWVPLDNPATVASAIARFVQDR